jgi:hypothetical protein
MIKEMIHCNQDGSFEVMENEPGYSDTFDVSFSNRCSHIVIAELASEKVALNLALCQNAILSLFLSCSSDKQADATRKTILRALEKK